MTGEEFSRQKRLLSAYEALQQNPAYVEELAPLFNQQLADAVAGLRNRQTSRDKRDEHLVAADNAENLTRYVDQRIGQLRAILEAAAKDLTSLDQE